MSLASTKNNIFLIEVFNWIFDNRLTLIIMFIEIGAFMGEITILFVSVLWLRSEIYAHLSYFLQCMFCRPKLLFRVYILST